MKMKYAAIVTYTTNVKAGVTITANDLADAWSKVLEKFEGGQAIHSIEIATVLPSDHDIK